ncbi:hypothetical protein [Mesorhizobium sp. M1396]|uniref:hypothetical protein n=1 Tax=Mesorhizobium sp. M1396 TaxID=2957095 RepID=UPI003338C528
MIHAENEPAMVPKLRGMACPLTENHPQTGRYLQFRNLQIGQFLWDISSFRFLHGRRCSGRNRPALLRPAERRLGVDAPLTATSLGKQAVEGIRLWQEVRSPKNDLHHAVINGRPMRALVGGAIRQLAKKTMP